MIEITEDRKKRALLVSLNDGKSGRNKNGFNGEDAGRELRGLAETLELEILGHEKVNVRDRQPQFGIGSGKAEELAAKAAQLEADLLVFDWDPSPSQQRNWEELAGIPVLDRQELIIKIFAARAATREAELQVQLAELHYRLPRLAHKYIDLSRQRGGRYGTKGTGETRLETDRRAIEQRIHRLEKQIEEVAKQRQVQRRQRERHSLPICAIAGYTNAGKSSLLNALTGSSVLVEDKLFATLDTTTRRFEPVPGMPALLVDTVGFIRRLPHSLIRAFRSTLEEVSHAELLLHVLDASDANIENCYRTTVSVLQELGAGEIPVIIVLNKIDCLRGVRSAPGQIPYQNTDPEGVDDKLEDTADTDALTLFPEGIAVSARNGSGLDQLKNSIAQKLKKDVR